MKISLNDHELERSAEGELTIGQVLDELKEEIRRGGKVVTQVVIDGRELPMNWQRNRLLASKVKDANRMNLLIEDAARLKRQTVQDAGQLVQKLVRQSKPLGKKFRIGDEVTANNDLASYLEDLKWILAGLDHTTRNGNGNHSSSPARDGVIEKVNRLLPTLDRIYKAQAAGDYIAIADEIEYDLYDELNSWTPLFEEVQSSLDSLPQEK